MPFFHFYGDDADYMDEDAEEIEQAPAQEGFQYESMGGHFNVTRLEGVGAMALKLLLGAGVGQMRVCYDGGNDEGFAHADDVWINGERKWLRDVIHLLNTPENLEKIRAAAAAPDGTHWYGAAEHYLKREPRKAIQDALDELAHEVASQLLGDGYGTGEYELYGAATVNFENGQITDDPKAAKPLDQM